MLALARGCQEGRVPAVVALVVSAAPDTPAVEAARALGLSVEVLPSRAEEYESALLGLLQRYEIDWIALAGYLRLLPEGVLQAFEGRVLNIHPALLPKFGGQGMYGMRVHEAVLAAGETESGCSVHLVTENYDEGPVILQLRCPVEPSDTPQTLAQRVLELEHRAYPEALKIAIERYGT